MLFAEIEPMLDRLGFPIGAAYAIEGRTVTGVVRVATDLGEAEEALLGVWRTLTDYLPEELHVARVRGTLATIAHFAGKEESARKYWAESGIPRARPFSTRKELLQQWSNAFRAVTFQHAGARPFTARSGSRR